MQLALTGTHSVIILLKGMEGKCLRGWWMGEDKKKYEKYE